MLKLQTARIYFLLGLWIGSSSLGQAQVSVLTNHNDNGRTGANLNETILNTSNVNVTQFGKLFSRTVDGQIYAQPLYVPSVSIPGLGIRNVVYVATAQNSVYAFDADNPNASTPLWQVNLGPPVPFADTGSGDIQPVIGIISTPVIDPTTNTIYCVAKSKESGLYFQRLHALDIATGQEKLGGPRLISASVPGTGDGSAGGLIQFNSLRHLNRPGLLLLNGHIYIAFGAHSDIRPYHGWVFAYNAATLQQVAVWNSTPNDEMSGIWQSGQGLAADPSGYIYFITANGAFNAHLGGIAYGQSFVKLATPSLTPFDYFTPNNYVDLNNANLDLGTPGPMLLPGTNRLVGGSKEGILYLVDTSNMGHFNAGSDQVLQRFLVASNANPNNPIHGSPVYWSAPPGPLVYVWPDTDFLRAFRYSNGLFETTPAAVGNIGPSGSWNGPHTVMGAMLSLSSSGSTPGTGILWATRSLGGDAVENTKPGILHAFDAADITRELWNSVQNAARDDFGNFAKFCPPTIANGKVYMATFSNQLVVYGLNGAPPPPDTTPPVISNGQPTGILPPGTTQTTLSVLTHESAACRYATTAGVAYPSMPSVFATTGGFSHTTLVTGLADNQVYNYYVRCSDSLGNTNTSDHLVSFIVGTAPPATALVAAYAFSENSGTSVADSSGNSNAGAISGASWTAQGKFGNALVFNGTSARVTINDSASLHLTTGMTLEAWVKPSTVTSAWRDVIYKGNDNYYLEGSSPQGQVPAMGGTFSPSPLYGTASLAVNTWSHLAATYDGATMRLYVNGVQVVSRAQTGNILISTNPLQIGGDSIYGQYFAGTIDEVRVYNRALSPAEIQTDMITPAGGTPPSDTTPPVLSNGQPTGTLSAGTAQTTLSAATNENTTCRYATTAGIAYASMPNVFSTTGGRAHSTLVTGLTNGQSYSYYVRCSDSLGNANTSDYVISFAVGTTPASGLVAAHAFNENTGTTTADSSGNSNTGTLNGATWTAAGKFGNALVFNGTSAQVTMNDSASLHLTTGMTLEAWVNPSTVTSAWRDVIYKGDDNYFLEGTSSSGGVPAGGGRFGGVGAETYGTATLAVNTWTHLAVTYDGATLRLYVNGVQVASQAQTGNILTSTNPLQIGGDSLYGQYFAGTIDEVRVYNRALSPVEIQTDMNTPVGAGGANPVPALTTLVPNSARAGGAAFTLTVNGSNFVSGSEVRWNGAARTTTFVSAAQVTAAIPATDITTAGTPPVTVFNPAPGGGTSNALTFTINGDTTQPDTNITGSPSNPSNSSSASFSFTSTEAGSFQCRLDGASFSACTSPQSYTGLTPGSHTFQVRAVDLAGNIDSTPASYTWTYTPLTLFPGATVIQTGSLQGGTAASLNSDDNNYFGVNSTTSGTLTTSWYGSFIGVPSNLNNLRITYKGKNSRNCTQTIAVWHWTTSTWVQLNSRNVGTTEILIANLSPTGALSSYVGPTGEFRVQVQSTRNSQSFVTSGDLMQIVFDIP